jgi:hypothetical protein
MNFIKDEATGLIGHREVARHESFSGSDDEETYKESLKTQPADWIYRNTKVTYKRNEYGHRTIPMSNIKQDGYLLTTGCSFTEGIGLPVEDVWPHVLSQRMGNIPYYNLGLASSGPDLAMYNLCRFLTACPYAPGYIVLFVPPQDRMFSLGYGFGDRRVRASGPWDENEGGLGKLFQFNVKYYTFDTNLLKVDATWKVLKHVMPKTKFVAFTFHDVPETHNDLDRARDLMHRGPRTNQVYADFALGLINS